MVPDNSSDLSLVVSDAPSVLDLNEELSTKLDDKIDSKLDNFNSAIYSDLCRFVSNLQQLWNLKLKDGKVKQSYLDPSFPNNDDSFSAHSSVPG